MQQVQLQQQWPLGYTCCIRRIIQTRCAIYLFGCDNTDDWHRVQLYFYLNATELPSGSRIDYSTQTEGSFHDDYCCVRDPTKWISRLLTTQRRNLPVVPRMTAHLRDKKRLVNSENSFSLRYTTFALRNTKNHIYASSGAYNIDNP